MVIFFSNYWDFWNGIWILIIKYSDWTPEIRKIEKLHKWQRVILYREYWYTYFVDREGSYPSTHYWAVAFNYVPFFFLIKIIILTNYDNILSFIPKEPKFFKKVYIQPDNYEASHLFCLINALVGGASIWIWTTK